MPEELRAGHPVLPPETVHLSGGQERWTGELVLPEHQEEAAAAAYA